jgi:hypothetical protein
MKLLNAIVFLFGWCTTVAGAQPPTVNSIFNEAVTGCHTQGDASEIALLAARDQGEGIVLLTRKVAEKKCGRYAGLFLIQELVERHGRVWVFRVSTHDGQFYIFHSETPEREGVKT